MAAATADRTDDALVGAAPPSPAGPAEPDDVNALPPPPAITLPRLVQVLRFNQRQIQFVFRARRELGEVFRMRGIVSGSPVITSHPDHVRSLFTAKPPLVPSLTEESPLRPIVGGNSVLTAQGERHMLLLPHFHGDAIERYVAMISDVTDREIDRWPVGRQFQLAPRMQAITLDVIMAGIFGIEGRPRFGSLEFGLRTATQQVLRASTLPMAQVAELLNIGSTEPRGMTRVGLEFLDRPTYALIAKRRRAGDLSERGDILSLLLRTRTEEGEALTDQELRDELLTLVLAGHETTANSLAWTWERLVRTPEAHERLVVAVRDDDHAAEHVEATITEGMRTRPVIPMIGRRPTVPWRLGEYAVPADTPITMSILLLHHREDLYAQPFAFRPERWLGRKQPDDAGADRSGEAGRRAARKPATYHWIPFGGGTRRCLGAALAMAEQRVVLEAMVRRLDLEAPDPEPERALHRNVTMIPAKGARVVVRARR